MRESSTFVVLAAMLSTGCFLDGSVSAPNPGPMDGGARDGGGPIDDRDGDGHADAVDCDPDDRVIGATAQRTCSSPCGAGVEKCEAGVWSACDAPTSCGCADSPACTPGASDAEMRPCGACGGVESRSRTCTDGCAWAEWSPWSACSAMSACAPGEVQSETMPCSTSSGSCPSSRTRTRTCEAACTWGAWSDFSECATPVCRPFDSESRRGPCGCGGTGMQDQRRICTSECTWGDWFGISECRGDTRCTGRWGGSFCPCTSILDWTCCPDGRWSDSGCGGCP